MALLLSNVPFRTCVVVHTPILQIGDHGARIVVRLVVHFSDRTFVAIDAEGCGQLGLWVKVEAWSDRDATQVAGL